VDKILLLPVFYLCVVFPLAQCTDEGVGRGGVGFYFCDLLFLKPQT
jgi:hypothetical protein